MSVSRLASSVWTAMPTHKLIERITLLLEVNLQDLLLESADPRETVAYWRAEMQGGLADAQDAVARAVALGHQVEKQFQSAQSSADQWDARVDAALRAGDEKRARAALKRKMAYQDMARELQRRLAHQHQVIAEMKRSVSALQEKVLDLAGLDKPARPGIKPA